MPIEKVEPPLPLGVSAEDGRPLPEASLEAMKVALQEAATAPEAKALEVRANPQDAAFGAVGEVDPQDLSQTGWAVLFGPGVDPKIKEALKPLLALRKQEVGGSLYKEFEGAEGYQAGETAMGWLKRKRVRLDVVDPLLGIPFYLLIVAPPESVPFEFQYTLDLYWAVGRLWFDKVDEFRQYAESVVAYEKAAKLQTTRHLAVFAPQHDFDRATQLFVKQVAEPMVQGTDTHKPVGLRQKYKLQSRLSEAADKSALLELLTGKGPMGTPAMLFTGSHGMEFKSGDPRQKECQGALVCQDWEGFGGIGEDDWFSAKDVPKGAKVHGMIPFIFACHGGGCPRLDNYSRQNSEKRVMAEKAMLARLPLALLTHPDGGALAVLAHVERAWAYSFRSDRGGPQVQGFRDVIARVLRGERIGQATDAFNTRWAALSTELSDRQNQGGEEADASELASLWIARDDARNYIILGDPAVRLRADLMAEIV
jgi:hypothetical protein